MTSPWLVDFSRTAARSLPRLVCFAHAGGGPSTFNSWGSKVAGRMAILAAALPGREARLREASWTDLRALIEVLDEAIDAESDAPVVLFGHSFGALLAFEVARRRTARNALLAALIVSGRRAPHFGNRRPELHALPPAELMRAIGALAGTPSEILADDRMMAMFLPSLQADLRLNERYAPLPGGMLACPILALMGEEDSEVEERELLAWRELTSGPFRHQTFPGGHFYLKAEADRLLNVIVEWLRACTDSLSPDRVARITCDKLGP
jgi:surfactin synthase thioesterase subunit